MIKKVASDNRSTELEVTPDKLGIASPIPTLRWTRSSLSPSPTWTGSTALPPVPDGIAPPPAPDGLRVA